MIRVAILGSTGSIGRSALAVVRRHPDRFQLKALVANRSAATLAAQVAEFRPATAVLCDESVEAPSGQHEGTMWRRGIDAMLEVSADPDVDVVLNSLVGAAGLRPTLAALEAGHRLALANKESLVAGGALVLSAAERGGGEIVPIDSEHSAILQCLQGTRGDDVQRVTLTASGGPFRGRRAQDLADVKAAAALRHPTWDMGAKITIDSATLANKALEVVEAHFLYGLGYDRIAAVVHPQSVIHSFVEFVDGSVLAQLGFPTMELPILYALDYPNRVDDKALRTYDPVRSSPLTFEEIDHEAFPMFSLGVEAGRRSGCAPAVYNAGNEIAVQAFIEKLIPYHYIPGIIEKTLQQMPKLHPATLEEILEADQLARKIASQQLTS